MIVGTNGTKIRTYRLRRPEEEEEEEEEGMEVVR